MPSPNTSTLRWTLVFVAAAGLFSAGCVQRRLTIRSNPPGAQVYIDNQEIGRTPVSTDYIYYGRRSIRLVKDGYETLTVKQSVWAPWYEWPVLAFFSENVWPWEIRDERMFDYQMQPAMIIPSQTLLSRAEELRAAQVVTPVPAEVAAPPPMMSYPVPAPTSSPYLVPQPQYVPPAQPPVNVHTPPPAILNYPPPAAPQPAPNSTPTNAPVFPSVQYPGDFGGRPVPAMP